MFEFKLNLIFFQRVNVFGWQALANSHIVDSKMNRHKMDTVWLMVERSRRIPEAVQADLD